MIVVANFTESLLVRLFAAIGNLHRECEFRVVDPQFIALLKDDENTDDRFVAGSGGPSYALSCDEIVTMLREGHLGFDWTDVAIVEKSEKERIARILVYVQCIDAGRVYVMTEEQPIIEQLLFDGFSHYSSSSLPYATQKFADII
jgi:hypothetical protein